MSVAQQQGTLTASEQEGALIAAPRRATPLGIPMVAYQVGLGLAILALWQLVSGRFVKQIFISSPLLVAERLVELFATGEVWLHLQVTLLEFGVGWLSGSLAGVGLGIALARTQFLAGVLEPYIVGFYSIPKVAIAPLFIIWLGIDLSPKIAIAAVSAFFLVFVNTFSGIRGINEEFIYLARLMGASRGYVVLRVMLPSAAPHILLGLRTSVPYAMIGAVIGEFIASNRGLGYLILSSAQLFDSATLFASIILIVALVMAVTQALAWLERRIVRWRPVVETKVAI
jgi:NitT/TauT family transport system permease protein